MAVDVVSGQKFAIKRVLRNDPSDDRFIQQAETEYEVSSQLEHPVLRKTFSIHRTRKLLQIKELYL